MRGLRREYGAAIVGGGPAGLGPLLAASRDGTLGLLLERGLVIVDLQPSIGAGRLGEYAIRSDSAALSFLACLDGVQDERLAAVRDLPSARALVACGSGPVELVSVARFLADVGHAVRSIVDAAPRGLVLTSHEVLRARQITRSFWRISARAVQGGSALDIKAGCLLLACGGIQDDARLARERLFAKVTLSSRHLGKVMQSDLLLRPDGIRSVRARLARQSPRALVLGGSTSALASARLLLQALPANAAEGAVTVLHRGRLRLFYPSPAEARASGYDEFGPDDICPLSGFVHRLGGLRYDARELVRNAHGLERDRRLALLDGDGLSPGEIEAMLDEADLVVAALGYRPQGLPLRDRNGVAIRLAGDERELMVDDRGRLLDASGAVLPGAFGIGLAAGWPARGAFGGEPSFHGQTNGLWLWQHQIGALVAAGLLESRPLPERLSPSGTRVPTRFANGLERAFA